MTPNAEQEAITLSQNHWAGIESILVLCHESKESIQKLQYFYETAFQHGFKHGVEFSESQINSDMPF